MLQCCTAVVTCGSLPNIYQQQQKTKQNKGETEHWNIQLLLHKHFLDCTDISTELFISRSWRILQHHRPVAHPAAQPQPGGQSCLPQHRHGALRGQAQPCCSQLNEVNRMSFQGVILHACVATCIPKGCATTPPKGTAQ